MKNQKAIQNIFLIGTIHGHTPPKELERIIDKLSPNQLLIELPEDAPKKFNEEKDIRNEMMLAYQWAKNKGIPAYLFDEYQPLFNDGMSVESPEFKQYVDEMKPILKKYSWKDFNISEISKQFDSSLATKLFDTKKEKVREEKMLAKIKQHIIPCGNIVIITGTGHLDFFKDQFPGSILPLR